MNQLNEKRKLGTKLVKTKLAAKVRFTIFREIIMLNDYIHHVIYVILLQNLLN